MRILGIDPGSRFVGYGIIDIHGHAYECLDFGTVCAVHLQSLDAKLLHIFEAIQKLLRRHKPDAVAIEGIFGQARKFQGALLLGQARGVALLAVALEKTPVFEYAPARIKKAVGAGGNGSKAAVTRMVRMLLKMPEQSMRADAYDGLAIALCHAHAVLGLGRSQLSLSTSPSKPRVLPTKVSPLLASLPKAKGPTSAFAERLKKSYVAPKEAK